MEGELGRNKMADNANKEGSNREANEFRGTNRNKGNKGGTRMEVNGNKRW